MGMVIGLLKGCCLKISTKLLLKPNQFTYSSVQKCTFDQMDNWLLRCMERGCSLLSAQPSCTKCTHKLISPSYRVIL